MQQKIIEILQDMHPEADLAHNTRLVDDGILDSMDIVTLITELNAAFEVSIPAMEIVPDNFNSAAAMADMIQRIDDI
jgi:acyl carrier protein